MSSRPFPLTDIARDASKSSDAQWFVPCAILVACQYLTAVLIGSKIGFLPSLPTAEYMGIAFVVSLVGASVIVLPKVHGFWREQEKHPLRRLAGEANWKVIASYVIGFQLVAWQMGALTWLKDMLPQVIPYWADPALASLDRTILGADAWRLIPGWLTRPFDIVYVTWAFVETAVLILVLSLRPSPVKSRAMLAYFLIVGLMGVCGQYLLSSAGPVFYDQVFGGDRFAGLTARNGVNAPFVQLGVNMLWSSYSSHTDQIGNGISAMPSMHVATTAWVALSLSALSPKLRRPAWAYWLAIFIGSFVLGWHYFLDGVVATVGAVGCWTLAHRLITRERNTIRRDKLAAVI
jgi:hypothetical protein